MTNAVTQKRIDEILLMQGKVSESEISAALSRQKAFGGKLCSHLFEHSSASEKDLVSALSQQFGLPGVAVSDLHIPPEVVSLIPGNVTYARQVLPFEYDVQRQIVKIACVDPADTGLLTELNYILGNKKAELHLAVELSLSRAINTHYGSQENDTVTSPHYSPSNTGRREHDTRSGESTDNENLARSVLLVTDQDATRQLLKVMLEKDGFTVDEVDSATIAIDVIQRTHYGTVFIQSGVPGNSLDLANRLRVISPTTRIRRFESLAGLIVDDGRSGSEETKLHQKLDLFTSLLTIKERVPKSHSSRVGYLVDRLCRRLALTEEQRVLVVGAAYLHDRAKFYYMSVTPRDFKLLINLVTRLLQSVYYEPSVIEILRTMYCDLTQLPEDEVPFTVLAGNILTAVDMYGEALPPTRRLTLDKLAEFKSSVQDQVGKLLLPNIYETFFALMEQEAVSAPVLPRRGQIMIYSETPELVFPLESRLKGDGFRTISAFSLSSFIRLYRRSQPDLLILQLTGSPRSVITEVSELKRNGVDIKNTPTFVLTKSQDITPLTPLLEWGIEDIISYYTDPEQISLKINRRWTRMEVRPATGDDSEEKFASKGKLSDMNLVELLQVLGPSRRTTKITVVASARPSEKLEIYLELGNIVFAQLNNFEGAEAIYVGLTWDEGSWMVEPITHQELQEQNNQISNEAILLEGCRIMDEMSRQI